MSAAGNPPPDPKKKNEPYPYSFDDETRPPTVHAGTSETGTPEERRKWEQKRRAEQDDSLTEDVLETIDDGLGCSNRLFGCVWSLGTLPFRLVWRIIGSFFD